MDVGTVGCWGRWWGWWGRSILTSNHSVIKCNGSLHGDSFGSFAVIWGKNGVLKEY